MSDHGTEREPIPPALTADEWGILPRIHWLHIENNDVQLDLDHGELILTTPSDDTAVFGERIPALIALANATLPDSDPRKITREKIAELRDAIEVVANATRDEASNLAFLDALSSYLPPEGP